MSFAIQFSTPSKDYCYFFLSIWLGIEGMSFHWFFTVNFPHLKFHGTKHCSTHFNWINFPLSILFLFSYILFLCVVTKQQKKMFCSACSRLSYFILFFTVVYYFYTWTLYCLLHSRDLYIYYFFFFFNWFVYIHSSIQLVFVLSLCLFVFARV